LGHRRGQYFGQPMYSVVPFIAKWSCTKIPLCSTVIVAGFGSQTYVYFDFVGSCSIVYAIHNVSVTFFFALFTRENKKGNNE
jgi:hypothetical protein